MDAKINFNQRLKRTIDYNEKKVKEGMAQLVEARLYPIKAEKLTLNQKVARLANLDMLNDRVKRKTTHMFLHFDIEDKLTTDRMKQIARDFVSLIGYDGQPYLLYQHLDTARPHLHLVTSRIKANGKSIYLPCPSEAILESCKKVNSSFGLKTTHDINNAQKTGNGARDQVSRAIQTVINSYHFGNISSYKALLKTYKIELVQGLPGSHLNNFQGLLYKRIDESGIPFGTPFKASALNAEATMFHLKERFEAGAAHLAREQHAFEAQLDAITIKSSGLAADGQLTAFRKAGIEAVISKDGKLFWIDHARKSVFEHAQLTPSPERQALATNITTFLLQTVKSAAASKKVIAKAWNHRVDWGITQEHPLIDDPISGLLSPLKQADQGEGLAVGKRKKKRRKQHL